MKGATHVNKTKRVCLIVKKKGLEACLNDFRVDQGNKKFATFSKLAGWTPLLASLPFENQCAGHSTLKGVIKIHPKRSSCDCYPQGSFQVQTTNHSLNEHIHILRTGVWVEAVHLLTTAATLGIEMSH